jgi:hypothetical protein
MLDALAPIKDLADQAAAAAQSAIDKLTGISLALAAFALPASMLQQVECDTTGASTVNGPVQAAIDAGAKAGTIVYIGPGHYLFDASKPIQLRSNLILVVHPDAILQVKANGLPRYYLFLGTNVSDVLVFGARGWGDRLTHDYSVPGTHEWGMGFGLKGCTRVTLRNCAAREFTGDGFSVSGVDIFIINCSGTFNRRQGLSGYQGENLKVIGGNYSNNGNWMGNAGAAPMSGIDLEPDAGILDGALIQDVTCDSNGTCDIQAVSNTLAKSTIKNVVITGCTLTGTSPNGIEASGAGGPVEVTALRNTISARKGACFRIHKGATANIGGSDKADANTTSGNGAKRTPALLQGDFKTGAYQYDVQVDTGGIANVGWMQYQ